MSDALDPAALDALREMTGGDADLYAELLDTFLSDVELYATELDAAAGSGDPGALVRPAHSMKSNALNVGATELAELCRRLEADARSGSVPDAAGRVAEIHAARRTAEGAVRVERAEASSG